MKSYHSLLEYYFPVFYPDLCHDSIIRFLVVWERFFKRWLFATEFISRPCFSPFPVFQYYRFLFVFSFSGVAVFSDSGDLVRFREAVLSFPSGGILPSSQYYCFPFIVWLLPYHSSPIFHFWKLRSHIPSVYISELFERFWSFLFICK